jgi:hypothetical protein
MKSISPLLPLPKTSSQLNFESSAAFRQHNQKFFDINTVISANKKTSTHLVSLFPNLPPVNPLEYHRTREEGVLRV